jgi:hypothetical protein
LGESVESKEMSLLSVDAKRLVGVQLVKPRHIKLERKLMRAAAIGLIGCAVLITLTWTAAMIWFVVRIAS